jgi:hypothetical protein
MIVCPACNAENLDGKPFCHQCGGPLSAPAMVDCVVCAAPVKVGAKFCKRCGSVQPVGNAAVPAPSVSAPAAATTTPPPADDDDSNKTVILTPQARDAMLARARTAQSPQAAPTPAATPQPTARVESPPAAPPRRRTREEARQAALEETILVLDDDVGTPVPVPRRNYLAIGLGVGAFLVACLVSALLLMSGRTPEPPASTIDTAPIPQPDMSVPVDASAPASSPLTTTLPAPQSEAASTPVVQATASVPQATPVQSAPVIVAEPVPTPPVSAAPAPARTPTNETAKDSSTKDTSTKAPSEEAPVKKPKSKPKQDAAAAKRKQAEEALQRLLTP